MTNKQTRFYQQGKRLEERGNALLEQAKAKFDEAYAAGAADDANIGVDYPKETERLKCAHPNCTATEGVQMESARTAYHWDGKGENPNADIPLCREHAAEHHAYWDEMWAGYYSGLGV